MRPIIERNRITIAIALAMIPFAVMLHSILIYHVDLPFWDQWNFVPLLGKAMDEGISFDDLRAQHNEHRLFFPRLIMLGLAKLTGYNILAELIFSCAFMLGIFVIITRRFLQIPPAKDAKQFPWQIIVFSLFVFSLNQGENLVWGWQIQIFLNIFSVFLGLHFLVSDNPGKWYLALAILFGIIATYSFANGLLYWILGLAYLALRERERKSSRTRSLIIWSAASVAVIASYLYKFSLSDGSKNIFYFVAHPFDFLSYIFKYLGAPIINYPVPAMITGMIALAFFAFSIIKICRYGIGRIRSGAFFILIGLYAIFSAMMSAAGRLEFGSDQAMSYRYVSISSLIWLADIVFLCMILNKQSPLHGKFPGKKMISASLIAVMILMLGALCRTSYRVGHSVLKKYHETLAPIRETLSPSSPDEDIKKIYIHTDYVRYCLKILQKEKLSIYRDRSTSSQK